MKSPRDFYRLAATSFGEIGMVWTEGREGFRLRRVFLPLPDGAMTVLLGNEFPDAVTGHSLAADRLAGELQKAMEGMPAAFGMDALDLRPCRPFQRTVLAHCFRIPRGRACTYGDLARAVGVPQGARAVGMVMAGNPFPLIIPCHRVVRSDGALGGFGGGLAMKKALLAGEGVILDDRDRVVPDCLTRANIP